MNTIHRFVLRDDVSIVDMPSSARPISVGVDYDTNGKEVISVWAEVDDNDNTYSAHRFCKFGTGANMDSLINFRKNFLGTVIRANRYACHVYEVLEN